MFLGISKNLCQKMNCFSADGEMTWDSYHSYESIRDFSYKLAKDYPRTVRVVNIGNTIENREIPLVIISRR